MEIPWSLVTTAESVNKNKRVPLGDQDGFTLLEAMVVISVLTVSLSLAVHTFKPLWAKVNKKMFITKLEADLYYAHSYAISRKERVNVTISRLNNEYSAMDAGTGKYLYRRKLSVSNRIAETNIPRYTITPDGNISPFGTVVFQSGEVQIKLTTHIGRGRFVVSE